jgi:hypothetical protein
MTIDPTTSANYEPATIDSTTLRVVPTPKVKLQTLDDVRVEMARIYRDVKAGRRDTADGSRMTFMLAQIGKMIELADVEKRLEHLERAMLK